MKTNFKAEYQIMKKVETDILTRNKATVNYKRDDYMRIPWDDSVIGIYGERGIGKTTILLQRRLEVENAFYFSADHAIIRANGLFAFVYYLYFELGITYVFIDEIFRYDNRKQELKNILDSFDMNVVFSGSSSLAVYDGVIDLGRRAYHYKMYTLSFREFLKLKYAIDLPRISFETLITNHEKLSMDYGLQIKQSSFDEYLQYGAYPFGLHLNANEFITRLQHIGDRVILEDLKHIREYDTQSLYKLSNLLYFIADTSPSDLSINSLSKKIGLHQTVVDNTLFLLAKIGAVNLIQKGENLSQKVRKEYKIFLGDTNTYYAWNLQPELGTIREAFFASEIQKLNTGTTRLEISLPQSGDFKVEFLAKKSYYFEIGGKGKSAKKYPDQTFIVKDGIEVSENEKTIPLWLFGFLN